MRRMMMTLIYSCLPWICAWLESVNNGTFSQKQHSAKTCGKIASLGVGLSYGQGRLHKTFFFSSPKYDFLAFQTASLGVGLSYGQGRLHKTFSSYRQNSLPSLVAVRSLRWVLDYRTNRVDSIKLFFQFAKIWFLGISDRFAGCRIIVRTG